MKKDLNIMNQKRIVVMVLIGWAFLIFMFSSQPYKQQDLAPILSRILDGRTSLGWLLDQISFPFDGRDVSVSSLGTVHFVEFFIRKGVHFFIFAVLGFILLLLCSLLVRNKWRLVSIAWCSVVLYACMDEIHQYFTDGRSALWQDVVIDSIGGLFGIGISYWLMNRRNLT